MAKKTINISVEEKLKTLYDLQCVDSEIDQLRIVRGELPVEIQDLEDEIARLEARLEKFEEEKSTLKIEQKAKKVAIKNSEELIVRYKKQLENIKNNREFIGLAKH